MYLTRTKWYYALMTPSPKTAAPKASLGTKAKTAGKTALNALKNVRLGSPTGYYKTNTLGESLNTAKMLFKNSAPPKK